MILFKCPHSRTFVTAPIENANLLKAQNVYKKWVYLPRICLMLFGWFKINKGDQL